MNPNIVNVTDIRGKTAVVDLSTTNATLVVENTASSGKIFKINSLIVSNVDGTNAANITVSLYSEDNIGGTATEIVSTVSVPADSSLVVFPKTLQFIWKKTNPSVQRQVRQVTLRLCAVTRRFRNASR